MLHLLQVADNSLEIYSILEYGHFYCNQLDEVLLRITWKTTKTQIAGVTTQNSLSWCAVGSSSFHFLPNSQVPLQLLCGNHPSRTPPSPMSGPIWMPEAASALPHVSLACDCFYPQTGQSLRMLKNNPIDYQTLFERYKILCTYPSLQSLIYQSYGNT